MHMELQYPDSIFSPEAKNFLSGLLTRDSSKRLGCSQEGIGALKSHPWFCEIEWQSLKAHAVRLNR